MGKIIWSFQKIWQNSVPICDQNCQQTWMRRAPFQSERRKMKMLVNIIFIAETLKAFLLRLQIRQECLLSPFFFTIVLKFLASIIEQGKKKSHRLERKNETPHTYRCHEYLCKGFPCSSAGKESACNVGDLGSIPGLGRSHGEGKATTPVVWPWEFHGLYSSWGLKELMIIYVKIFK